MAKKQLLKIQGLYVKTEDKSIIKDIDLVIGAGELHVLMGPNGSGKSTLAYALMKHPGLNVKAKILDFENKNIKSLSTDERARAGIFLAFQYPLSIPGISLGTLLPSALKSKKLLKKKSSKKIYPTLASKEAHEQKKVQRQFQEIIKEEVSALDMDEDMLYRNVNEGFSGGEKKKAEMLQMLALKPKLAILDEPDSGLDVDALKKIAEAINRSHKQGTAILLITHYQRILKYLKPKKVHLMHKGTIVHSGGPDVATLVEKQGYASFTSSHGEKKRTKKVSR